MSTSSIEWTDATWNPVTGCTRVSAGCDHCYAVRMTYRLGEMGQQRKYGGLTVLNGKGDRQFNGQIRMHDDALSIPLGWRKPRKVFVNSMSDLFHNDVPFDFIWKVFGVMSRCPHHTFQILTKRPDRMAEVLPAIFGGPKRHEDWSPDWWHRRDPVGSLPNVWLGTSVENQAAADRRIPHLLKCPAAVRFLSCEPLLGPVNLEGAVGCTAPCGTVTRSGATIDWVIAGGESGPGARPMHPDWARSIRDQCVAAGVPFFFKQWGEWMPGVRDGETFRIELPATARCPARPDVYEFSDDVQVARVGKFAAGRQLDSCTWDEMPAARGTSSLAT